MPIFKVLFEILKIQKFQAGRLLTASFSELEIFNKYDRSRRDIYVLKKYGLVRLEVKYGEKTLIYKT